MTDVCDGLPEGIVLWRERNGDDEADWWVIRHERSGITTQGRSRVHALLMLIDALSDDPRDDLLALAEDVFIPSPEDEALFDDLASDAAE